MSRLFHSLLFTCIFMHVTCFSFAQTLGGTDELGRTLLEHSAVGDPIPDRQVGMFYFVWLGEGTAMDSWDLSEIVAKHPEVLEDFHNEHWGKPTTPGSMYFWGKPIYEYYHSTDYWVALRNIQLLTDAKVDFLVIDATNKHVYPESSDVLMRAMNAVRVQGKNPPKIVFYTNTASGETMQMAYDNFYKEGAPYKHPECWYYLDGKPLILGRSSEAKGTNYEKFFTYRESQWPNEDQRVNGWPWISFTRPQKVHYNTKGEAEIINVSVSQHPNAHAGMGGSAFYGNKDNWGRSYHNGNPGNPEKDIVYGYNFQEQWDYALTQNVPFVFVTGWNEWVAGKWSSHDDNPEHSWFCDQATPEYSRDIEPTYSSNMKDNYYMQLVNNIRRYKGVEKNANSGPEKTIKTLADWSNVDIAFTDYIGETTPRNWKGAQRRPIVTYVNNTGRNDFQYLKVARDKDNLYFYAEAVDPITTPQDDSWMRLYLDVDRRACTGWKGFDYRVIKGNILQKYQQERWNDVAIVEYKLEKNKLMVTIPRSIVDVLDDINIEYKWADNMQQEDPMEWYINGDCAPGARFNCIYTAKNEKN